ncbi:MAG TPA: DUF2062 domain-containing protein [Thermoanaerobaculia bacterium]|nr:DUF2062 domain-containing protein [Thermoanaerobaculia bacterium]
MSWHQRLRELLYQLRVEGGSPERQAAAVALGMFIGCTPLYGLHLPLCVLFARMLGVNRIKTYLAAHISTPVLMPFLLFFEVQTGKLVRGKPLLSIRPSQVPSRWRWDAAHLAFWHWKSWLDLLVGSAVLGLVLAALCGLLTLLLLRRGRRPPAVEALIEATAHRYLGAGLIQCEIVRGKLRHDPVYFALLRDGALPSRGRLLDLGCGRGIALALLASAGDRGDHGDTAAGWPTPPDLQLLGIEADPHPARVARAGLLGRAAIETADLLGAALPQVDAILLIDVLHYLPPADQQRLLAKVADALPHGGRLLVREADAGAGWRFQSIRLCERLTALWRRDWRQWRQGYHYRPQAEWIDLLAGRGLTAKAGPMGMGTPYANVLIQAVRE